MKFYVGGILTFCAAFILGDTVHFVADAAITSKKELEKITSLVGEDHVDSNGVRIEEGANKLIRVGDELLTFAGSFNSGINVAQTYLSNRERDLCPFDALELAIVKHSPPFGGQGASFLLGFYDGGPKILKGMLAKEPILEDAKQYASVGASSDIRQHFDEVIRQQVIQQYCHESPSKIRALVAASCIGVAICKTTIEAGVGGVFNSASVGEDGINWMEDIAICVLQSETNVRWPEPIAAVSAGIRNGVMVAREKIGQGALVTAQFISSGDDDVEQLKRYAKDAMEKTLRTVKLGKFAFAALVNKTTGRVEVLDMNRSQRHHDLVITPPERYIGKVEYGVAMGSTVRERLVQPSNSVQLHFTNYKAFTLKQKQLFARGQKHNRTVF